MSRTTDSGLFQGSRVLGIWTFIIIFLLTLGILTIGLVFPGLNDWATTASSSTSTSTVTTPESTKSVTETTTPSIPDGAAPVPTLPPVSEVRTTTIDPGSKVVTETTTPPDPPFGSGLISSPFAPFVFAFFTALLAGYLSAAAAQRIYVGRYGFTLGPLSVPELAVSAAEANSATPPPITLGDVIQDMGGIVVQRWWTEPLPPDTSQPNATLLQRTALEAGLRELAEFTGIPPVASVRKLLIRIGERQPDNSYILDGAQLVAIDRLITLGDRVRAGAKVEDAADIPLRSSFGSAITNIELRLVNLGAPITG